MTAQSARAENNSAGTISTGSSGLDRKIADGLPCSSLTLIEGENDTGKSVLSQQIIRGALKQGLSVDLFTTENTGRSFILQMQAMNLDISDYFAWGYLKVFPLHVTGAGANREAMAGLLARLTAHVQKSRAQVVVIDSLTLFTEYAGTDAILAFFTSCKSLADQGRTVIITLHTYAFEEETLVRIRSICDIHLSMKKALVGDKYVMVMETVKVRGARKTSENLVSFEVRPGSGMKIIPMSVARV